VIDLAHLSMAELYELERELGAVVDAVLVFKSSPAEFNALSVDLEDILQDAWVPASSPAVGEAVHALAEIQGTSLNAAAKWTKGKAVVDALQKKLEQAGEAPLSPSQVLQYGKALAGAYKLGLDEVSKPLGWSIDFGTHDKDAIHGMGNAGLFWIGEHYGEALDQAAILDVVKTTMLQEGLGREEAGRRLQEMLGGQIKRSDSYWTGLAATIATRSRSFGALSAMSISGAYRYEYVNPMDERTSPVCAALNGRLFTVGGAVELRDQLLQASTPDEWKALSPWPKTSQLYEGGTPGGKMLSPSALQAAGIAFPPLHFHCRSTIEVRIWQPLGADGTDPLGNVEPENLKPPTKKPKPVPVVDLVPAPIVPPPWTPEFPGESLVSFGQGKDYGADHAIPCWRALLELQGYTTEEIDGLLASAGDELTTAMVDGDTALVSHVVQTHPPAVPVAVAVSFPPKAAWIHEAEINATPGEHEAVIEWLTDQGYTSNEAAHLLDHVIPPDATTPAEAVVKLRQHPPGKVGAAHVPKPKPIAVGEQAVPVAPPAAAEPVTVAVHVHDAAPEALSSPAVEASQVPTGPIDVHAGYAWTPPVPDLAAFGGWSGSDYAEYAEAIGYSKQGGELTATAKAVQAAHNEAKAAGLDLEAQRAAVLDLLQKHPPASVVGMSEKPPAFLGPDELGRRLTASGIAAKDPDLGHIFTDALTSERYLVRFQADERQARSEVIANALYRKLGLEAPVSRVVVVGGKVGVATREPVAWVAMEPGHVAPSGLDREMAGGLPADAWLGNWNVVGTSTTKIARRQTPLGIGGNILRTDNSGVFAFRFTGAAKPFDAGSVPELVTLLDESKAPRAAVAFAAAKDDPSLLLPMMDRIGQMTDAEIRAVVAMGGLPSGDAEQLSATLIGRRNVLQLEAAKLRARLEAEAKLRAEQERQAEIDRIAAGKRAKKRAAELAKMMAQGKIPPEMVVPGVRLPEVAHHLETQGAITVAGDHGVVRDQMVRVRRYAMVGHGGVVQHEGYEVFLAVDQGKWKNVEDGLKKAGGKQGYYLSWPRVGFGEGPGKDTAGSAIAMFDDASAGARSTFLGKAFVSSDKEVDVAFGSVNAGSNRTIHGHLRLQIKATDPIRAQVILEETLARLGIDAALQAPTADAAEAMRLNKALWSIKGGKHRARVPLEEARRLLAEAGVSPADIEQVATSRTRGTSTVRIRDRWRKYRKNHDVRFLYHETGQGPGKIEGVAGGDGGEGGLVGTSERWNHGVAIAGMSSGPDQANAGGSSVFTRLVSGANCKGSGGQSHWYSSATSTHRFLIHPRVLDRVDYWGNASDAYGALTESERLGADALVAAFASPGTSNSHEIMLRYNVPADDLLFFAQGDQASRKSTIAALRAAGVTTIHGYPVEDMVVVMKTPGDFSGLDKNNPWHAFVMGLTDDVPDVPWK
jgi:hypothetical protein